VFYAHEQKEMRSKRKEKKERTVPRKENPKKVGIRRIGDG